MTLHTLDGDGTDVGAYRSVGHVAFVGELEFFVVNEELRAAPATNEIEPDSGIRVGSRFESTRPAASGVLSLHLAGLAGGEPAWWQAEAERLLSAVGF